MTTTMQHTREERTMETSDLVAAVRHYIEEHHPSLWGWLLPAPHARLITEYRSYDEDGRAGRWTRTRLDKRAGAVERRERWPRRSEIRRADVAAYPEEMARYAAGRIAEAYGLGTGKEMLRAVGLSPRPGDEARAESQTRASLAAVVEA